MECHPLQPTSGFGERRKLPAGSGVEPQPQTILGCFMCSCMRFHASFGAFNSCLEMADSYIPLLVIVGLMFPLTFLGVPRTPQLEFWLCPDTHDTHSSCATVKTVS